MDLSDGHRLTRIDTYGDAVEILRSYGYDNGVRSLHDGALLTLQGKPHTARRRTECGLFRREMLAMYEQDIIVPALRKEIERATGRRADLGAQVDLVPVLSAALIQVAAGLVGLSGVQDADAARRLADYMERMARAGALNFTRDADVEAVMADARAAESLFHREFVRDALEHRRWLVAEAGAGRLNPVELPRDLITLLVVSGLEEPLIYKESVFFLTASAGTTARGTMLAMSALFSWLDEHPEDRARGGDRAFLSQIASEALRVYPVVPGLFREATQNVELASGRQIVAGEMLYIDLDAINRDPALGADMESFDPYRTPKVRAEPYGLTFGAGPHKCIGAPLANGNHPRRAQASEEPWGAIVQVMRELVELGARLNPADLPTLNPHAGIREYLTFPLVLDLDRTSVSFEIASPHVRPIRTS